MGGIIGRLFREFAVTICVSVLISGFIALTLTPMLCSRLLKPHGNETHGRLFNLTERGFEAILRAYERSLEWVMSHRPITLVFSVFVLVATYFVWTKIPKGLFPPDDTGQLNANAQAAQGTPFEEMLRYGQLVSAKLSTDTNVASYTMDIGGGFGPSSQIRFNITLKPAGERPPADQMVFELQRVMGGIDGIDISVTNPPSIQIGGRGGRSSYQYTLRGADIEELYKQGELLMARLENSPMVYSVNSNVLRSNPAVRVNIDRARALAKGVTPLGIAQALANAYNQQQVSTIFMPTNQYTVVMEAVPSAQTDASVLEHFYVPASGGRQIPLTEVATLEMTTGPQSVAHSGQMASMTIFFNLAQGVSLGAATLEVERIARETLPPNITGGFSGTAQAFQDSQKGMGILLMITIFIIYIILGILYESFIHPITILTGLPFAAFGALFALYITGVELGVYGYVGIIMLIGIVEKNAIMMIDFALERQRSEHISPTRAIVEAASVRFRPIMMTTVSAIVGTLPIAIGVGASAASRRPLGVAVVGGLAFSQVVTLYVTPVFYSYFDELQSWIGRRAKRAVTEEHPVPVPVAGD
jgi:HAE1 family hydrophobic/amphiphilic exporter-1